MPSTPPSPPRGMVFDQRYRILRELEAGGMGTVYEAEQIRLGKRVAIKVLRRDITKNEVALRRFEREARLASRIRHRNVVELVDFGVDDKTAYYVMELLEGRSLAAVLHEQGALPWRRARAILLQIARALQAAHRLGIIHRDVKPGNCFLLPPEDDDEGELVKVLDFGIAKLEDTFDAEGQLTKTSEVLGTVAYMSPEQAQSNTIDARSDVYSLGVLVYQVLTGTLPFTDDNAFNVLLQHVQKPPPSPRETVPVIPEAVEEAVLRALAKDPDDRFESMEAFKAALAAVPASAVGAESFDASSTGSTTIPRELLRGAVHAPTVVLEDAAPEPVDPADDMTEIAPPPVGAGDKTEIAPAPAEDDLPPAGSTIPVRRGAQGGTMLVAQPGLAVGTAAPTMGGTPAVVIPGGVGSALPGVPPVAQSGPSPAIQSGPSPIAPSGTVTAAPGLRANADRDRERRLVTLGVVGGVIALVLGAVIGAWMTSAGGETEPRPADETPVASPPSAAGPAPAPSAANTPQASGETGTAAASPSASTGSTTAPAEPATGTTADPETTGEPEGMLATDTGTAQPSSGRRRTGSKRRPTDASVKAALQRKAKKRCGGSGSGRVQVSLSIDASGAPSLVRTAAPHHSSDLGRCVRTVMDGARFPATGDRRAIELTVDI